MEINNKVFIGDRNTGKTTWLYNCVRDLSANSNKKIVIMDSATDHINKSLLQKVKSTFPKTTIISPNNQSWIIDQELPLEEYYKKCKNSPITHAIANSKSQIDCIDLSFYLEKGHKFASVGNLKFARKCRNIYSNISQQVALCCMSLVKGGIIDQMTVITDEIEFPQNGQDITKYQTANIVFISAVHPENSFGKFYKSFKNIDNFKEDNSEKR